MKDNLKKRLQELAGIKTYSNNETLCNFLNSHIRDFANYALKNVKVYIPKEEFGIIPPNFELYRDELTPEMRENAIQFLISKGLSWNGEGHERDAYVSWNFEVGVIYNISDEPDPGSFEWEKIEFKGVKFYELEFNL